MDSSVYDEAYFLRGRETGKSLYTDYRWLPAETTSMVLAMIRHLGIEKQDLILDFGAARGYSVRAFRELGYKAYGYDTSAWAIANADESIRSYMYSQSQMDGQPFDWIIAKDVLEHISVVGNEITKLLVRANKGVFAVVPLSPDDGEPYTIPDYEKDVTHVNRLSLASWVRLFVRPGWEVTSSYRVEGVKDNWYAVSKMGNGFIVARRVSL